jgi:hypothetical protein
MMFGMANEKSEKPESKFAEVIRKGKEKRAGMDQQSATRAKTELEIREREEADRADQAPKIIKDSEI